MNQTLRILLFGALAVGLFAGCGSSDPASDSGPCRTETDCPDGLACVSGECIDAECVTGDECASGVCIDNVCDVADAGGEDVTNDVVRDVPLDDTGERDTGGDDTGTEDGGVDATPDAEPDVDYGPLEYTIEPADGATDVAIDASIVVTFNQPMNALRFIPANLTLTPLGGEPIAREISYDPATWSLTLSPAGPEQYLQPATPYIFRMAEFIGSESGETLGEPQLFSFATETFAGTDFHGELARAWAPVVYQQAAEARYDTFTRFDYDDDLDTSNNLDNAAAAHPGHVYYAVVETPTHWFVTYMLYYPGARPNDDTLAEHDTIGIQMIVEKSEDEPLGELFAWSTFYRSTYTGWAMDAAWYGERTPADGDGLEDRLPVEWIENDRNVSLFVESGHHSICLPNAGIGRCVPTTGDGAPFEEGISGLVYRAGDEAQAIGDAESTELTYALLSFVDEIWVLRDRVTGEDALFGGTTTYRPAELEGEMTRPGAGLSFPTSFVFEHDGLSFGDLPFLYARDEAFPPDTGWWFVDPVWVAAEKWTLPETASTDYCFNPWLGIDARDSEELEGCTPSDYTLPEPEAP